MSGLSGIFGWFQNKWIRQPLILGPSENLYGAIDAIDVGAGTAVVYGAIVPADEIWVLLATSHVNYNSVNSNVLTGTYLPAGGFSCTNVINTLAAHWYCFNIYQVLFPSDRPYSVFYGCTLNDDLKFGYKGFKLFTGET